MKCILLNKCYSENSLKYSIPSTFHFVTLIKHFCDLPEIIIFFVAIFNENFRN
jgi:hypothetical protein